MFFLIIKKKGMNLRKIQKSEKNEQIPDSWANSLWFHPKLKQHNPHPQSPC